MERHVIHNTAVIQKYPKTTSKLFSQVDSKCWRYSGKDKGNWEHIFVECSKLEDFKNSCQHRGVEGLCPSYIPVDPGSTHELGRLRRWHVGLGMCPVWGGSNYKL